MLDTQGDEYQARRVKAAPPPHDAPAAHVRAAETYGPQLTTWLRSQPNKTASTLALATELVRLGVRTESPADVARLRGFRVFKRGHFPYVSLD